MTMAKRTLALLLCLALCLAMLPAAAFAEEEISADPISIEPAEESQEITAPAEDAEEQTEEPQPDAIDTQMEEELTPEEFAFESLASNGRPSDLLLSFDMGLIRSIGHQPESGPCGCYAQAYCCAILDGYASPWYTYNVYGNSRTYTANWPAGGYGSRFPATEQEAYALVYSELQQGRPSILKVNSNLQHYVTVVGCVNVPASGNFSPNNFLILNPSSSDPQRFEIDNMGAAGHYALMQSNVYQVVVDTRGRSVGFVNDPASDYLSKCDYYPSCLTIQMTKDYRLWSLPCDNNTDPSSEVLSSSATGTMTVTGMFRNDVTTSDHYWYRVENVKLSDGKTIALGYVYAPYCKVTSYRDTDIKNGITYSGKDVPTSLSIESIQSYNGYPVDWTVSSVNADLSSISGYIGNYGTEMTFGRTDKVRSKSLKNSPVDTEMRFDLITNPGSYTLTIKAKAVNYYCEDGKNSLKSRTVEKTLINSSVKFEKDQPHTHDKGTYMYYEEAHPHYKCYKCSVCGTIWRDENEPVYVSSCGTCNPVTPTQPSVATNLEQQIRDTYSAARQMNGGNKFEGWCGNFVAYQLVLLGINTDCVGGNGKDQYDYYKNMSKSSGGYNITAYPASSYSIASALNAISANGTKNVYNILVGFEKGYGSDGAKWGHVCFIHGIENGLIYYSESFSTSSSAYGGIYREEGSPIVCSISAFSNNYINSGYVFDGVIHFDKEKVYGSEMTSGYSRILPDGDYVIAYASDPIYYLDIVGQTVPAEDFANVALCKGASAIEDIPDCDIWTITYSDGFYEIRQKNSTACLDVENAENYSGVNVAVYKENHTKAQKWAISKNNGNSYRIQTKCSGFSLDVSEGICEDGRNVQVWENNDTSAQAWMFIPITPVPAMPYISNMQQNFQTGPDGNYYGTFRWDAVDYATKYLFSMYMLNSNGDYEFQCTADLGSSTYMDVSLCPGWYIAELSASNESGTSEAVRYWFSVGQYTRDVADAVPVKSVEYNNHLYERYDYHMSWTEAKAYCEALGGHLVTITSAEENSEVCKLFTGTRNAYYWIGLSDTDFDNNWTWINGETGSYRNWDVGEPTRAQHELYSAIAGHSYDLKNATQGYWIDQGNSQDHDYYNDGNFGFICEYDEVDPCYHGHTWDKGVIIDEGSCTRRPTVKYTCVNCGEEKIDYSGGNWSDWSENYPEGIDEQYIQAKTLYRIKEKETVTQPESEKPGWTPEGFTYSDWGSTQTSSSKPTESETLRITSTTQTGWGYFHYCGNRYNGQLNVDSIPYGSGGHYHSTVLSYSLPAFSMHDQGGNQPYGGSGSSAPPCEYNWYVWFRNESADTYSYSYQTRAKNYVFSRFTDWSDWSETPISADDNTQVETKTLYRYDLYSTAQHSWDNGEITTSAGCQTTGVMTFHCTKCTETRTEIIPAKGHTFNKQVSTDKYKASAATCTEAAKYYYSCECGEKGTQTFSYGQPLGHTFSTAWSYDDTYHWHAATCEHTTEVSGKAVHNWGSGVVTKEATATETGVRTYTCSGCKATKTESINYEGVTVIDSGECGDDLTWTLYSDGLLKISGSGDMWDYNLKGSSRYETDTPWYVNCQKVLNVEISDGVTSIGRRAFQGCSELTSMAIPSGVTSIGHNAFNGCKSMTSVEIPLGVTIIGNFAFCDCSSLASVVIPQTMKKFNVSLFSGCSKLESVVIPSGVTSIGDNTFEYCSSLTSIDIPSGVKFIGKSAFFVCTNLKTITIPSSVVSIEEMAFCNAYAFPDVYYDGTAEQWNALVKRTGNYNNPIRDAKVHFIHTHTFSPAWSSDDTYHWHAATCEHTSEVSDKAVHDWDDGVVTKEATATEEGVLTFTCTVCEATRTEVISKIALPGDMNGDGSVNNADTIRLMNYIKARGIGVELKVNGDVNNDGSIDNADILRLMKYVKETGNDVERAG